MARSNFTITNPTSESSRIPNSGVGSNRGSADIGRSGGSLSSISEKVINSLPYQNAYKLFSSLTDTSWLTRLSMIPYSVDDANFTWFDEHGWSNASADKQDANYQYCMEQIAALVAEYQAWNNSLPATQANQLAQAGSNAAITGQGLTGSDIPNVGVNTDPSSIASTNPSELVLNAANFVLDAVNGLSSVVKGFKELGLGKLRFNFDKQKAFLEVMKYFSENGISSSVDPESWEDLFNPSYVFSDPKGDSVRLNEILKLMLTAEDSYPYLASLTKSLAINPHAKEWLSLYLPFGSGEDGDYFAHPSTGRAIFLDAVVDAQMQDLESDLVHKLRMNKYQSEINKYGSETAEHQAASSKFNKEILDYTLRRRKIEFELIDKLHQSSEPEDKALLMKILMGYNADDMRILDSEADLSRATGISNIISRALDVIF